MKSRETAGEFHQRLVKDNSEPGQFTIYRTEDLKSTPLPRNRRDFYKISLTTKTKGTLAYGDKTFQIRNNALVFLNPMIPYAWEPLAKGDCGYSCLFTEEFIDQHLKSKSLVKSALFQMDGNPVLIPDQKTIKFLTGIFEQMLTEMHSSYLNKYDLLRSYVQIIIHEALKMEPLKTKQSPVNSSTRISALFLDLLERQFPIIAPQQTLQLKNAGEFAERLSVHTNHLNRAVKEATGKTTTEHISERLLRESKALLLHSNWDIAEIGYCLGFGHASNFNIFFKKQTGTSPSQFRRRPVSIS